jgi:hypothetical protein
VELLPAFDPPLASRRTGWSRRSSGAIKGAPTLWISSGPPLFFFLAHLCKHHRNLSSGRTLAIARGHLEAIRVSPKLRQEVLLLLVKSIEPGSSQSTPMSSVCCSPATVDLLLQTIFGLSDELYSSVVSS